MPAVLLSPDLRARLATALHHRLAVIADHAFRDRDPQGHLAHLRAASEHLDTVVAEVPTGADPQFRHYLERRSYDKALAWLEER